MILANPIRILVLHSDPVARAGLTATFNGYPDLEVVESNAASERSAAAPCCPRSGIDVVVADYEHGIALCANGLRRPDGNSPKILILASHDREREIRTAIQQGVHGYLLRDCELDDLASGVRAVHLGGRPLSPQVARRLAESLSAVALTTREEEVLRLVVDGLGNKTIARRLDIASGTVKSHLRAIFDKLGVGSRTQAISSAERRGLLCPPCP